MPNRFNSSTCCVASACASGGEYFRDLAMFTSGGVGGPYDNIVNHKLGNKQSKKDEQNKQRKEFKSECKAQQLLRVIVGHDQWKVYRKTNLVAVKGNFVWLIGNYFKTYDKFKPFSYKPDVIRIDKPKIWNHFFKLNSTPATSFCIQTNSQSQDRFPYTDQVVSFMVQCAHEEKEFYKIANRINEITIKTMPECALYDGNEF